MPIPENEKEAIRPRLAELSKLTAYFLLNIEAKKKGKNTTVDISLKKNQRKIHMFMEFIDDMYSKNKIPDSKNPDLIYSFTDSALIDRATHSAGIDATMPERTIVELSREKYEIAIRYYPAIPKNFKRMKGLERMTRLYPTVVSTAEYPYHSEKANIEHLPSRLAYTQIEDNSNTILLSKTSYLKEAIENISVIIVNDVEDELGHK